MSSKHSRVHTLPAKVGVLGAVAVLASTIAGPASAQPSAARATAHPTWIKLSAGQGVSPTAQPRVARWGTKLIVAWQQAAGDQNAVDARILGATGQPTGAVSTVASWYAASTDPQPMLLGGVPTVAFGGLRTSDITDAYAGEMAYAQAGDATSWSLGAGSLTQTLSAYGDYGFGVVDVGNGHPVSAGAYSTTDHVTVHDGLDTATPAAQADQEVAGTGAATDVNAARDPATGAAWAVWYAGSDDTGQLGVHAATIWPTIGAPTAAAPLSTQQFEGAKVGIDPAEDVAVTGRIGGGVWAAYPSGYPVSDKVVLWHVGTGTTLTLPADTSAGEVKYTGISAAPGGRLWVWWVQNQTLYAVRTNPSVTRFGVVRTVVSPATDGQAPTRTGGDGSFGPLDAVINVIGRDLDSSGNPEAQMFSTRILEGLRLTVLTPQVSARTGGSVVVAVSDAGVPVAGVAVRFGGTTVRTNRLGRAVIRVPAHSARGTHAVTASLTGWYPATAVVRVR